MTAGLPIPTLLSQVLVAFTIEFDNETEHRLGHRTTVGPTGGEPEHAPWLVSQAMWANVLQFVEPGGTRVADLHARSRTTSDSLAGLRRWGYVTIDPWPHTGGGGRAPADAVVRLTRSGRTAGAVWQPLAPEIEGRWRSRFGAEVIGDLALSLRTVVDGMHRPLPRYLPVVHPTSNGKAGPHLVPPNQSVGLDPDGGTDLSVLVARVLLGFTLDFEAESRISLPISANTLRVLDDAGTRVRDLPRLTGVSKEANAMASGFLERHGCIQVVADPSASRGKVVPLSAKGRAAQAKYRRILDATEEGWNTRYGAGTVAALRRSLEQVSGIEPARPGSLLFSGTEPYPDGWRASVRPPETLPHYPMVLHRGGYPDGS